MSSGIDTLLIFCSTMISAFAQDTSWLDRSWKETAAVNASYYRIKAKSADHWKLTDYYLNGKPQMTGAFLDDSLKNQDGEFNWYDSSGSVTRNCTFANNKLNGAETLYYPNHKPKLKTNYKDGRLEGEGIGYYPSGKISGKARYKNDKQITATIYHEDGSPDDKITEFLTESEFPGGPPQWLRFLNKTFRYPEKAFKNNIQGEVVVQFIVTKEGKLKDIEVIKSVDPLLDAEAIRVMKKSPDWLPAVQGGILVNAYKKQPIIFKLQ